MNWSRFVGIPETSLGRDWSGVDCWGLYRLVLNEEFNIDLPCYAGDYVCAQERAAAAAVAQGALAESPWVRVEIQRPFDLLLFRVSGIASHIGCAVDARHMLHTEQGGASAIVPIDGAWARRLQGVFRHEALA